MCPAQATGGELGADALGEAGYDGILVAAFFTTPLLYCAFSATSLVRYCRARRARRAKQ